MNSHKKRNKSEKENARIDIFQIIYIFFKKHRLKMVYVLKAWSRAVGSMEWIIKKF